MKFRGPQILQPRFSAVVDGARLSAGMVGVRLAVVGLTVGGAPTLGCSLDTLVGDDMVGTTVALDGEGAEVAVDVGTAAKVVGGEDAVGRVVGLVPPKLNRVGPWVEGAGVRDVGMLVKVVGSAVEGAGVPLPLVGTGVAPDGADDNDGRAVAVGLVVGASL